MSAVSNAEPVVAPVMVDDLDATSARIHLALAARNIAIESLERITPSMEDVFVAMIEAEERKAAA